MSTEAAVAGSGKVYDHGSVLFSAVSAVSAALASSIADFAVERNYKNIGIIRTNKKK